MITLTDRVFTTKQFGKALELYYHKNIQNKASVGSFLNYVFSLNDKRLERLDTYPEACKYFKNKYVED